MLNSKQRIPEFSDGNILGCREVAGLTLGEIEYRPDHRRPLHTHERACLHFLLQGGYIEYQNKRSRECDPFTLSFQPQGHEHAYRCYDAPSRSLSIEIEDAWLARLREYSVKLDHPVNFRSALIQWLITRLYREFTALESDSALAIEALTLELTVEISRHQIRPTDHRPPPWLKRATDFLHEHFMESRSLQDIASVVGVHPVHLARTFRQHHQCSVGEYVRRLRIEFACRRISSSKASLAEIALAAGFYDQSQFSRTFKRLMGITPAEFRSATR